jgi:AcrR family transcriptional regulator
MKSSTNERLLDATLRLISEKGYLRATTKEIARKAGVTEVTLFRHFGSKERLFEEVIHQYSFLPRLRDLLSEIEGSSYSYEKVLNVIGMRFLGTLKERKSLVRIMTSEINVYPEKIREVHTKFIEETIQVLAGYFRTQQARGLLRRFSPEMAASAFLGMIFSYFNIEEIVKGRDVTKKETEKIIKEFVGIFVCGTLKGE